MFVSKLWTFVKSVGANWTVYMPMWCLTVLVCSNQYFQTSHGSICSPVTTYWVYSVYIGHNCMSLWLSLGLPTLILAFVKCIVSGCFMANTYYGQYLHVIKVVNRLWLYSHPTYIPWYTSTARREFAVVKGCIKAYTCKYHLQPQILHGSGATPTQPVITSSVQQGEDWRKTFLLIARCTSLSGWPQLEVLAFWATYQWWHR